MVRYKLTDCTRAGITGWMGRPGTEVKIGSLLYLFIHFFFESLEMHSDVVEHCIIFVHYILLFLSHLETGSVCLPVY